jgi:hypothetical protein
VKRTQHNINTPYHDRERSIPFEKNYGPYKILYKIARQKRHIEVEDTKSDTEEGLENAGDKIKAGAKAVANKIKDSDRDLGTEYDKEKVKEKVN